MTPELRERLGQLVRDVWIEWAKERRDNGIETKLSHVQPWEALEEYEREVDRRIGERLFSRGIRGAIDVCRTRADAERVYTPGPIGEGGAAPYERAVEDIEAYGKDGRLRPIGGAYAGLTARRR